jgi:aspartate/glutamate racemase
MKNQTTIGIIGGAGPMASCLLNQYIVENLQKDYGFVNDQDFPTIINYSYPFRPMIASAESQENRVQIEKELNDSLAELNRGRSLLHRNCLQYAAHLSQWKHP